MAVWLVKPLTAACYEIQTLIGFINYTACCRYVKITGMKVRYYQAVWLDENGGFRVNNAVSTDRDEAINMCRSHTEVKAGAKLHWVDEWDIWE